jgi:hypothetical protein
LSPSKPQPKQLLLDLIHRLLLAPGELVGVHYAGASWAKTIVSIAVTGERLKRHHFATSSRRDVTASSLLTLRVEGVPPTTRRRRRRRHRPRPSPSPIALAHRPRPSPSPIALAHRPRPSPSHRPRRPRRPRDEAVTSRRDDVAKWCLFKRSLRTCSNDCWTKEQ